MSNREGVGWVLGAALAVAVGCGSTSARAPEASVAPASRVATVKAGPDACRPHAASSKLVPMDAAGTGSTISLASFGARTVAFVADEDSQAVHVVDVDTGETLSTTRLGGRPAQLLPLADGRIIVAIRDRSKLAVLEIADIAAPLELRCETAAPADTVGLARRRDELLVTGGWAGQLARYDLATLKLIRTHEVGREPRAVVISGDQKQAFVAHAVGGKASVVDLDDNEVRKVALEGLHEHEIDQFRRTLRGRLAPGKPLDEAARQALRVELAAFEEGLEAPSMRGSRTSCQGFALARSTAPEGRIFAPQVLVDPGNAERRTTGYGEEHVLTEIASVAVIDEAIGWTMPESLRVSHMGIHEQGGDHCMLPRAAVVDPETSSLLVTCLGSDVVVAYDAAAPNPASAQKRAWRVAAGPTGIALDGEEHRAVVFSQFDRTLTLIPLGAPLETTEGAADRSLRRIELPADPEHEPSVATLLGRSLFHASGDQRIARDGRACASCHPDGRDDGLVWATPNGPRRTKMLAGTLGGTAPYSWDGEAGRLHEHLKDTFDRLGGQGGVRSVELKALVAYIESLPAPPVVARAKPEVVARGREIFASKEAGCAGCHEGGRLTDNEQHDVKSRTQADRHAVFNTPTLRHLAGRAPYFHDGRYDTLRALLAGSDGAMGHTKHLGDADLEALEAFLASL